MSFNFAEAFNKLAPQLAGGLLVVIETTIAGFFIAFILAIIFGLIRVGKNKVLKGIVWIILEIIRGTPLLVQMVYMYYVVPLLITAFIKVFDPSFGKVEFSAFGAGIAAMGLNYGCYMSEIVRSAIESIDIGQTEAALALGFKPRKALVRIVLPQALRMSVANFINYMVIMVKDTSLLSYITVYELLLITKSYASQTFLTVESYTILAGFYMLICFPLLRMVKILERRIAK